MITVVHGTADVRIVWDRKEQEAAGITTGKPFLVVTTPDGRAVTITLGIGELVGAAAVGARIRCGDFARAGNARQAH